MQKLIVKLFAVLLSMVTMFTNPLAELWSWIEKPAPEPELPEFVAFQDWQYTRPDVQAYEELVDRCLEAADSSRDVEEVLELVRTLDAMFSSYVTNLKLANLRHDMDVTDKYWLEEYNFCTENSTVIEAGFDDVLYALADSPLKDALEEDELFGEGFFDDYMGESIWDDTFTALSQRENTLMTQYNDLIAQAGDMDPTSDRYYELYGDDITEIYIQLVDVRQDIAAYLGYDNYLEYAYAEVYYRDYTPAQAQELIDDIRRELPDLYWDMDYDVWDAEYENWTEEDTFAYVKEGAKAMGGVLWEAFRVMEQGGFYDISQNPLKYDSSYTAFMPDYQVPFILMNSQGTGADPMTFTHEFGHFCNNYASMGSEASIDVAEIFSQSLELLSLTYCKDTESLAKMQMASALSTFVIQAFFADFENKVYLLDKDALTVENVRQLYSKTAFRFSFGVDERTFITVPHFFVAPVYVISYVTSADAALQIFQLEQAQKGAGLQLYMDNLDTLEVEFLAFLESAGLESPFRRGRAAEIRETLAQYVQ